MMATRRIMTRLQARKQDFFQSRKESKDNKEISPGKRKASTAMDGVDSENAQVDAAAAAATTALNKSFPPGQEATTRQAVRKKNVKAEPLGKQRQTLSERSVNSMRTTCSGVHRHQTPHPPPCASRRESPIAVDVQESLPDAEDITQDEVSELDDQTSMEEMTCEENITADAVLPFIKDPNQLHRPSFYPDPSPIADASMHTDPWRVRKGKRSIPHGVKDIDYHDDGLQSSIYSADIIDYLRAKELESPLPPSFLDTSPEVTPRMRGVLMDWLIQVQSHEELEEETLHLCVALIDRYLAVVRTRMPRLQLVGITCLLVATKFLERFAPEISTLCYLTANSFKTSQVVRYEVQVLLTLNFDLSIPVSTTFLRRYLQVHEDLQPPEVTSLANYLLDLSITSVKLASVLPSLLAASAIYLARRLVLGSTHAWTSSLAYYTSYTPCELSEVVNDLANLVFRAPSSKFQGARNKYNSDLHSYISFSPLTSAETVESHFVTQVSSV